MTVNTERINASAPYKVSEAEKDGYVGFITEYGVEYRVGFAEDDIITSGEVYQFDITNVNHKPSPNDPNVRKTIIAIVAEFFNEHSHALLYICETGDGKQAMRSRLFHHWIHSSSEYREKIVVIETEIVDEEGSRNYAALIVPKNNPNFSLIIEEFTTTVRLLQEKPA